MKFQEAIDKYKDKFGIFPYFLFMGMSEQNVIKTVEKSIETGKEVTLKDAKNINY
jgi:2-oxo-4-hydroxy-4-carboxy--5-ureidoimidazoline (OHCU) decarboxylase